MSRTDRDDLAWLFERTDMDSSISIRYVRTKEQLADIWTKGAFTTNQLIYLMRLFDIHQSTPKLKVDRSRCEPSCSDSFSKHPSRDVERLQLLARFRKWTVGRETGIFIKRKTLRLGKANARTNLFHKLRLEKLMHSAENGGAETNAFFGKMCLMEQRSKGKHNKER